MVLDLALSGLAATMMTAAAVSDCRRYVIPNWISVALVALYPLHAAVTPVPSPWVTHLFTAALLFAGCLALFALGLVGGGDAKLLPSVGLWAGPLQLPVLLTTMLAAGAVLALGFLATRALARRRGATMPDAVPYGLAIALGGLAALVQQTGGGI
jgi:prepilin peptidase CpaA